MRLRSNGTPTTLILLGVSTTWETSTRSRASMPKPSLFTDERYAFWNKPQDLNIHQLRRSCPILQSFGKLKATMRRLKPCIYVPCRYLSRHLESATSKRL